MSIVQDFYQGNAHIMIDDTYCKDKTKEEVDEILERIARKAFIALNKKNPAV